MLFKSLLLSIIIFFSGACDNYVGQQIVRIMGDSNHTANVFMGYYDAEWGRTLVPESFETSYNSLKLDFWWARNGLSVDRVKDVVIELDNWLPPNHINEQIIFIGLGTNWEGSSETHLDHYEELVSTLQKRGGVLILQTVNGTHSEIHEINRDIRVLAEKYGTVLLDWEKIGTHYLGEDGIHYTPEGWATHSYYGLATLDAVRNQCLPVLFESLGAK